MNLGLSDQAQPSIGLPEALHPLVRLVLGDPALQARLGSIIEPEVFEQTAMAVAAEHGIVLPGDAFDALFAPDPLGLSRFRAAPIEIAGGWPGQGWIPTRSVLAEEPVFDWSWFGTARTAAPLFEDSVRQTAAFPLDRLLRTRTGLAALIAGSEQAEAVPLTGLVYHMSRCGSTLLARMLGAPPQHLVASEPEPLDMVIKWAESSDAPYATKIGALRAVVAALGRRRDPAWARFFIKLDGWHILSHRLLRDAFPEVPWVFLHRDPVEVLVSLEATPGLQSVPGMLPADLLGIADPLAMPQDVYGAAVIARFCAAALEAHAVGGGMIVDYADLVPAALAAIPQHMRFSPSAEDRSAMAAASGVYSKDPGTKFASDSAQKQLVADPRTRELAQSELGEVRARLLEISVA